ncbi:MAG: hypothetical protein N3C12_00040 [Candidatus Binatia bacterium]|nr:hypothetical protein [Candidatus Binatia bacterium]
MGRTFRIVVPLTMLGFVAAYGVRPAGAGDPEEPHWLAGALLRQADALELSAEQRTRLQFLVHRAQATWNELTRRLREAERNASAGTHSDWTNLAQERGRLRVLADRDALAVLDREQRARWRVLQEHRRP